MQAVPACVQIGKDPVCLSFVAFSPFASFRGKIILFSLERSLQAVMRRRRVR